MNPLLRKDLAWAGFILVVAAAFGLMQHWSLVQLSYRGELPAHLEKMRAQRREAQFQGVKTVNLAQAEAMWQQGQTLFIDARPPEEYQELHIAGAVNLPVEKSSEPEWAGLTEVPPERRIIVYCGHEACDAALKVAEKLQARGFTQVAVYLGGFRAWDEAGYAVDTAR